MLGKVVIAFLLWGALWPAFGFSLLGPYAPWMAVSSGYAQPGDVGGPMRLGQEYRWNLPGITYGFHPRFERHFGSNGVRAVQAAIKILNQVPPASQIQLEDFPIRTTLINQDAQVLELLDLKSFVLSQLLYQLGLGPATRHVCVIRDTDLLRVILQRNYDPVTLAPTNVVNGIEYLCHLSEISPGVGDAVEEPVDEMAIFAFTAVTDNQLGPGSFHTGLTRDDVGGIRFLYSGANVNVERLPGSVTEAGSSIPPRVNAAPRPGIEKLTFSKMTWDAAQHRFKPVTQRSR